VKADRAVNVQTSDTLLTAMALHVRTRPRAVALHLPVGRRHRVGREGFTAVSYAELGRRSDALAAGFAATGIGPGQRAAMLVPPGADFFAVAFGLLKAGAVPVLIDPGIGRRNLRSCLREAAPSAFLGVPRAHVARRALGWCPDAELLITVGPRTPGGGRTLGSVERYGSRRAYAPPPVDAERTAAIAFTSGSTGVPKGVEYQHSTFLAQIEAIRALYAIEPGEVSVATFPPFALLGPLLGTTTVVPRMDPTKPARVNPARLADAVRVFHATILFGSPALLDTVSRWGARTGQRLPTLRRVICAGAPVPARVARRTLDMLAPGAQVYTPYGATEALPVSSIGSTELLALDSPGVCVGRPAPGVEIAIIPVTDEPLAALVVGDRLPGGAVGEIVVRGANVTRAYPDRPAATAAAKLVWDGQVAHRMGDVGYVDAAGRLWFCGRKVHRVTTADRTLYTSPVEEILNTHSAVRRSALVGVGPPAHQQPVICVQLEPPARPSEQLTAELLELAASHEATAAIRTVLYRKDFPVDIRHNSKIDRAAVAAWAARRLS
jgi:olefin beta-lactone synthetase